MRTLLAISLSAAAVTSPVLAEKLPVVVELFTSQGCSSCPPADAMMGELAQMDGVIALSLHVDYWDYIGWPDSFASPDNTARQEAYARAVGERMVYTPQMVMNGQERVIGGDAMAVMEGLHAHADGTTPVALTLTREGDTLRIEARLEAGADVAMPPLTVHLVRYAPSRTVAIEQGENAGLTVEYRNVVTDWQVVGTWSGEGELSMSAAAPGDEPLVVLLQEDGPGRIMAAKVAP